MGCGVSASGGVGGAVWLGRISQLRGQFHMPGRKSVCVLHSSVFARIASRSQASGSSGSWRGEGGRSSGGGGRSSSGGASYLAVGKSVAARAT